MNPIAAIICDLVVILLLTAMILPIWNLLFNVWVKRKKWIWIILWIINILTGIFVLSLIAKEVYSYSFSPTFFVLLIIFVMYFVLAYTCFSYNRRQNKH